MEMLDLCVSNIHFHKLCHEEFYKIPKFKSKFQNLTFFRNLIKPYLSIILHSKQSFKTLTILLFFLKLIHLYMKEQAVR
jgi:hypothetical protein